ncbi:MAG: helix-turn-helix domain-containing protein, partial [Deltaproteobacteria bacterium]|nr:helix-turn-helix domain-containing protein [Deltaproteobacteria bacterium]
GLESNETGPRFLRFGGSDMKANTSVDTTTATLNGNDIPVSATGKAPEVHHGEEDKGQNQGKPESELRAAARKRGLNLKQLAEQMGVNYGHLSSVANGRRPWTPMLRERAMAVLGEVPGQGVVYRQGGVVQGGESSYVRERARERGLTLRQVADRTGLSYGYVVQVSRGQRHLSPAAQARMESVLEAPVKAEAAQLPTVDPQALWERMDAHGWSQNEVARRAGISVSYLSQIMNGQRTPSGDVLRRLYEVLFAPTTQELVAPVELKVMAWKKGSRNGVVVKGAGGPGAGTIRTGGRVPWGAEVEFAYTSGYDSRGRLSVNHIVDERGYGVMLSKPETGTA